MENSNPNPNLVGALIAITLIAASYVGTALWDITKVGIENYSRKKAENERMKREEEQKKAYAEKSFKQGGNTGRSPGESPGDSFGHDVDI